MENKFLSFLKHNDSATKGIVLRYDAIKKKTSIQCGSVASGKEVFLENIGEDELPMVQKKIYELMQDLKKTWSNFNKYNKCKELYEYLEKTKAPQEKTTPKISTP